MGWAKANGSLGRSVCPFHRQPVSTGGQEIEHVLKGKSLEGLREIIFDQIIANPFKEKKTTL